jgi:hypothetical protein
MRNVRALLKTMCPAAAKAGSIVGGLRVERGEDDLRAAAGHAGVDGHRPAGVGHRRREPPRRRVRVRLPSERSLAASQREREPRVIRESRDELLADHAGRAEDADVDLLCHTHQQGRACQCSRIMARLSFRERLR